MLEIKMTAPRRWRRTVNGVEISGIDYPDPRDGSEVAFLHDGIWDDVWRGSRGGLSGAFLALCRFVENGGDIMDVINIRWTGLEHEIVAC